VDFRLAGRISRLIAGGFATGALGEVLLVPGKPKLPFDKILLFGTGANGDLRRGNLPRRGAAHPWSRWRTSGPATAVVELPWPSFRRHRRGARGGHPAQRKRGRAAASNDVWTLVEPTDAQRANHRQHMIQERRRVRKRIGRRWRGALTACESVIEQLGRAPVSERGQESAGSAKRAAVAREATPRDRSPTSNRACKHSATVVHPSCWAQPEDPRRSRRPAMQRV